MRQWFWVLDAFIVVAFAVIGREDHGFVSDLWDYARVAAPFLFGLGLTIVILRSWRQPLRLRTGFLLALGTLGFGMLLRRFVWDDGTATTFVVVAAGFFVAGMVGWRLVALGVRKVLARRTPAAA